MKPGRNDPCPCGSGKKYKKCCGAAGSPEPVNPAAQVNAELRALIGERKFHSLEELQAFVNQEMHRRNSAPRDDFQGLSPEQMHRLLHFPFASPEVAQFHPLPDELAAQVPIVRLYQCIAGAAAEKGLKATAQGNLPRALCREAFEAQPREHRPRYRRGALDIQKELDFFALHVARIVAEAAGLLKLRKGVFTLTAKGRDTLDRPGRAYDELFRAFVGSYNWAYADLLSPLHFIRTAFLFTLFLLHRHGQEWRTGECYADWFLEAFPMVVDEASPRFGSPDDEVSVAYVNRTLSRFAVFFGLAEERKGADWKSKSSEFRATPLLATFVSFPLAPVDATASQRVTPPPKALNDTLHVATQDAPATDANLSALRPLRLYERGVWDSDEFVAQIVEEGEAVPGWAAELVTAGRRTEYEMEQVVSRTGDDDAITRAVALRQRGREAQARKLLTSELARDARCLDAYAHFGSWDFDGRTLDALAHYSAGVRVGELTVPANFPGVLPWSCLDNRPFLRCLHGYGLCLWRLGEIEDARRVFKRMLVLNPDDNQGARFLLADLARGKRWEDVQDD